jgi:hypothetical protein
MRASLELALDSFKIRKQDASYVLSFAPHSPYPPPLPPPLPPLFSLARMVCRSRLLLLLFPAFSRSYVSQNINGGLDVAWEVTRDI